jgi:hypothetical protein
MGQKTGKRSRLVFPIVPRLCQLALQVIDNVKDTKCAFLLALRELVNQWFVARRLNKMAGKPKPASRQVT